MEVETHEQPKEIYALMASILSEIEAIGKTRRNEAQGYSFRGIDDMYNAVHPLFAKHGVFNTPRVLEKQTSERTTASGTVLRFVELTVAYDFFARDGSHVTVETVGEAMDAGDKASNKAMSAAHKYALVQAFCIPTGDVPDADFQTHEDVQPGAKPISRSSTAAANCPKCGGAMWDNRESKRNPRAPDYKCKDKSCDGAIWLDSTPDKNQKILLQSAVDICHLLNEHGDEPEWTANMLAAFVAEHFRGNKAEDLSPDGTNELLQLLNDRLDSLKKSKVGDPSEQARLELIAKIEKSAAATEITRELKRSFAGKSIYELNVDQLVQLQDDCVPF